MIRATWPLLICTLALTACGMPTRESLQNLQTQSQSAGCANTGTLIQINQGLVGGILEPKIHFNGTEYRIGSQSNSAILQAMNSKFPHPTTSSQASYAIQFGGSFGHELFWVGPLGPMNTQQNVPVIHLNCIQ